MLTNARKDIIKSLIPEMIKELNPEKMTKDDMLMVLGWNSYRGELLKRLKIK